MANYKYCVKAKLGMSAGYVKFNISPDLNVPAAPNEPVIIAGEFYDPDQKVYGVRCMLGTDSGDFAFRGVELGTVMKHAPAKRPTAFVLRTVLPAAVRGLGGAQERRIRPYISFVLGSSEDFSENYYMTTNEICRMTVLKERIAPEIRSLRFWDDEGHADRFGGFVEGESRISVQADAASDPLDDRVGIASAVLKLAEFEGSLSGMAANIGSIRSSGDVPYRLTVTDTKGLTAEKVGTVKVLAYAPPAIESLSAERYSQKVTDDGSTQYVPDAAGEHVRFNLTAQVPQLPSGNWWTLTVKYGGTVYPVRQGENGGRIELKDDRTAVEAVIPAAKRAEFTFELTDSLHKVSMQTAVEKSSAHFCVEPFGVAVGMRSTGESGAPRFESAYPARFYRGLSGQDGVRLDAAKSEPLALIHSNFEAYDARTVPTVVRVGPLVLLEGMLRNMAAADVDSTEITVAQLPAWACPRTPVSVLQQGSARRVWWMRVHTDGRLTVSRNRAEDVYVRANAGNQFPLTACWTAADAFSPAEPDI